MRKSINIFHRWILNQWLILDLAFYSTSPKYCYLNSHFYLHISVTLYTCTTSHFHSSHQPLVGGQKPSSNKSIAIISVNLLLCLKENLVTTIVSLNICEHIWKVFQSNDTFYICLTLCIFPESPHIY